MGAFAPLAARWLVGPRSLRRFWPAFGALGAVALNVGADPFVSQVEAILSSTTPFATSSRGPHPDSS